MEPAEPDAAAADASAAEAGGAAAAAAAAAGGGSSKYLMLKQETFGQAPPQRGPSLLLSSPRRGGSAMLPLSPVKRSPLPSHLQDPSRAAASTFYSPRMHQSPLHHAAGAGRPRLSQLLLSAVVQQLALRLSRGLLLPHQPSHWLGRLRHRRPISAASAPLLHVRPSRFPLSGVAAIQRRPCTAAAAAFSVPLPASPCRLSLGWARVSGRTSSVVEPACAAAASALLPAVVSRPVAASALPATAAAALRLRPPGTAAAAAAAVRRQRRLRCRLRQVLHLSVPAVGSAARSFSYSVVQLVLALCLCRPVAAFVAVASRAWLPLVAVLPQGQTEAAAARAASSAASSSPFAVRAQPLPVLHPSSSYSAWRPCLAVLVPPVLHRPAATATSTSSSTSWLR